MKSLVAILAMVTALTWTAAPTEAYLAHVSTSVAVTDVDDERAIRQALQTAVDDLLRDEIAFTPTLVVLTRAVVLDGRLYIRLLVADEEGERVFREGGSDLVAENGI